MSSTTSLRISEIFYSLQGESSLSGWPTVFIRLTGCPLRCVYCDTSYAFTGGATLSFDRILERVKQQQAKHVCVTGGEPLSQKNCLGLLTHLCDDGYVVSLETSGALDIAEVDQRVKIIMDIKTPDSGEVDKNRWENIAHLSMKDEVKFVITSREDYDWCRDVLREHDLAGRCNILMSPVYGELEPEQLAAWILEDKLPVRLQIQLHKLLWGERQGV